MVTVMNCTAENYYIHFPSLTFLGRNLTFFRLEGNIYPDKKIALFSMDNIITKLPQTEFKSEIMGDEYAQL